MLYIFFAIACVCSNYMIASEKGQQDIVRDKVYYDKIISEIKDDKERAKYAEGYVIASDGKSILPLSEIGIMVGKVDCCMSFPINHPIHEKLKKQEMEKNNQHLVMTK